MNRSGNLAYLIQYVNGSKGVKVEVDGRHYLIGRSAESALCVEDDLASREHALIEAVGSERSQDGTEYIIRDLDSTNGTFINGERKSAHLLTDGDVVRIGKTFLKFIHTCGESFDETRIIHNTFIPGLFYTSGRK